ncbi:MAG: PEP-CTERM sorting domain-containing protein [Azoarcus sp.]|jgi:hypothetical protein|nr:PEP-CTERM sorting domain-containing protein [Azoarcus sp.]
MDALRSIALAVGAGSFFLVAPITLAGVPAEPAVIGGSLYVADPAKPIIIRITGDSGLLDFHSDYHQFAWRDSSSNQWTPLLEDHAFSSAKGQSFLLPVTSGEIFFGLLVHDSHDGVDIDAQYSTGLGKLNEGGAAHAAVTYDYGGAQNLAYVQFEDTLNFVPRGGDWNDWTFTVTNVKASPAPEPETYAMLLAGLGIVGFVAKRRRAAEA